MIIDRILDRKDGEQYTPKQFYDDCMAYGVVGHDIAEAMDNKEERDVKKELCFYVIEQEYRLEICDYIMSVNWL
jgi:hypothetical protein